MEEEELPEQKEYVCVFFDCGATFTKSWKLQAHLCKHTGLRPYSCQMCDKRFCARYQLTRHELSHGGDDVYQCLIDECPETFETKAGMKNHMACVHKLYGIPYMCDHPGCEKEFSKRNKLKAHVCEHQQILPFCCGFGACERRFPTLERLKRHQKVHAGYLCDKPGCPFLGKTWTEYLKHRKEHKTKMPCPKCDKQFNNSWFLRQHELRVHSTERKKLHCPVDGCGKEFTHRFSLESHVLGDHEGKKPFKCTHANCGKSFSMRESLWRHGVVHDPAKGKIKKLSPKRNLPWRLAVQARLEAAACQSDVNDLTTKLCNASLKQDKV